MSVCLSDRKYQRGSHRADLCEFFFFGGGFSWKFVEKIKIYWNRTKVKVCFIVAGNIKSPKKDYLRKKLYQALRMAEEAYQSRERITFLIYTYIVLLVVSEGTYE